MSALGIREVSGSYTASKVLTLDHAFNSHHLLPLAEKLYKKIITCHGIVSIRAGAKPGRSWRPEEGWEVPQMLGSLLPAQVQPLPGLSNTGSLTWSLEMGLLCSLAPSQPQTPFKRS